MEEPKKDEWMCEVRRRTNKRGLTGEDAKKTVKSFG